MFVWVDHELQRFRPSPPPSPPPLPLSSATFPRPKPSRLFLSFLPSPPRRRANTSRSAAPHSLYPATTARRHVLVYLGVLAHRPQASSVVGEVLWVAEWGQRAVCMYATVVVILDEALEKTRAMSHVSFAASAFHLSGHTTPPGIHIEGMLHISPYLSDDQSDCSN